MRTVFAGDFFGQKDCARACSQYGEAVCDLFTQGFEKPEVAQELALYGAFAAGEHDAVDSALGPVEVAQLPDFKDFGTERLQNAFVFDERPLYRQHTNLWFVIVHYFPLSAMSRAISCSLMPTMASPKSSESLAISFASV